MLSTDVQDYKRRRQAWIDGVSVAATPQELCASVQTFEREMRRSKMLEGWDEVRAKWLQDLAAVGTCSILLYLVKQLRVYLGRQVISLSLFISMSLPPHPFLSALPPIRRLLSRPLPGSSC
jgi:hypothetical protein